MAKGRPRLSEEEKLKRKVEDYWVPHKCKYCGAPNPYGQAYCCRDHAPLGNYGLNDGYRERGRAKKAATISDE